MKVWTSHDLIIDIQRERKPRRHEEHKGAQTPKLFRIPEVKLDLETQTVKVNYFVV